MSRSASEAASNRKELIELQREFSVLSKQVGSHELYILPLPAEPAPLAAHRPDCWLTETRLPAFLSVQYQKQEGKMQEVLHEVRKHAGLSQAAHP